MRCTPEKFRDDQTMMKIVMETDAEQVLQKPCKGKMHPKSIPKAMENPRDSSALDFLSFCEGYNV